MKNRKKLDSSENKNEIDTQQKQIDYLLDKLEAKLEEQLVNNLK